MTLSLGVALDSSSVSAAEWIGRARAAEAAGLDYLSIEDGFGSDRPEASLVAALLGPLTRRIGLIPVLTTTHTEPFHLSTALATVDWVSEGRGGWQVRVSPDPAEARLTGRRETPPDLWAEAADAVEVVRRLWDSWQDDAIIKDVATGRYIDRDRLHPIDFEGRYFRVKGPSIVPRPPQGQPVVAVAGEPEFAVRCADVVFVTPDDLRPLPRDGEPLRIVVDVPAGTGVDRLIDWQARGAHGFRLPQDDYERLTAELTRRGLFAPRGGTLRERFGLPAALNRYEEARRA